MGRKFRANYSIDELIALTDEWEAWQGLRSTKSIHVRMMDLDKALASLSAKQKQAVFLVGMCQLSLREAAVVANVSHSAMWKRYQRGLDAMALFLNGG